MIGWRRGRRRIRTKLGTVLGGLHHQGWSQQLREQTNCKDKSYFRIGHVVLPHPYHGENRYCIWDPRRKLPVALGCKDWILWFLFIQGAEKNNKRLVRYITVTSHPFPNIEERGKCRHRLGFTRPERDNSCIIFQNRLCLEMTSPSLLHGRMNSGSQGCRAAKFLWLPQQA